MSHFTVLVVGGDPHEALAPFHQFECTGLDDEFVQDIDVSEETLSDYMQATKSMVRLATGELVDRYDERFYRAPTKKEKKEMGLGGIGSNGKGLTWDSREWSNGKYETRIHELPVDAEKVDAELSETMSYYDYMAYIGKEVLLEGHEPSEEHKYGYAVVTPEKKVLKVVDRTNPNAKWDWYQVGGRWSGMYRLKPGRSGVLGDRSLLDRDPDSRGEDQADVFMKGDVDWEAMRDEKEALARKKFAAAQELLTQFPDHKTFTVLRDEMIVAAGLSLPGEKGEGWTNDHGAVLDKAREAYHQQPSVQALKPFFDHQDHDLQSLAWDGLDEYVGLTLEARVKEARAEAGITHAVLYNGQWNEAGEMGWFGHVRDEKATWPEEFAKLIDSLSDDTVLTLVDCHI